MANKKLVRNFAVDIIRSFFTTTHRNITSAINVISFFFNTLKMFLPKIYKFFNDTQKTKLLPITLHNMSFQAIIMYLTNILSDLVFTDIYLV